MSQKKRFWDYIMPGIPPGGIGGPPFSDAPAEIMSSSVILPEENSNNFLLIKKQYGIALQRAIEGIEVSCSEHCVCKTTNFDRKEQILNSHQEIVDRLEDELLITQALGLVNIKMCLWQKKLILR